MLKTIPTVGSVVEVTTRHKNINYFTYKAQPFEETTRKGEVVKNAYWVKPDCISVKTGNPMYPISIIQFKNIVGVRIIKGATVKNTTETHAVKGKEYIITRRGNEFSCTCVGFKFHSKCKHITELKARLAATYGK